MTDDNDLMIINRSGLTIRTAVSQIRVAGRATQGVRIINLREGDAIASVMAVPGSEEEELAAGRIPLPQRRTKRLPPSNKEIHQEINQLF